MRTGRRTGAGEDAESAAAWGTPSASARPPGARASARALSAAHGSDRRSAGGISCERAADDRADGDCEQDDEWEEHVATTVAAHRPPARVFAALCRTFGPGSKSADCRSA